MLLSCSDDDIVPDKIDSHDTEQTPTPNPEPTPTPEPDLDPDPTSNCGLDANGSDFSVIEPLTIDGFEMTQILPDQSLITPWEITLGPDNYLWVSERESYKIVRINPKTGDSDELIELNEATHFEFQTGLLGIALHPEIGQDTGNDHVYASYTYNDGAYKQKIVRMDYSVDENCNANLSNVTSILTDLPASGDHNSGRLVFGPDNTLYYTIGDLGANQFANKCEPVLSQIIPTQSEIDSQDWSNYPGKILRINLDGTIPNDNPIINGVKSHIYSYGHRNAQGLNFAKDGTLYSNEHGPKTDDEINIIEAGKNYGWPHVAGYKDDMAYSYCTWADIENCQSVEYNETDSCPEGAPTFTEDSWDHPDFTAPISTFESTVDNGFNFDCGNGFYCFPTIAPSSIQVYDNDSIPEWGKSLLSTGLKSGRIFRTTLAANGQSVIGTTQELFATGNRYRGLTVSNDGKAIYVITDGGGPTSGPNNEALTNLNNPGTILKFEYVD